ncbi:MAG: ABC transporter ATP-binding protein [Ardenticatenales bacterium]
MDAAIRFEGVTKTFVVAHDRPRSFQEAFVRVFRRPDAADRDVLTALDAVSFDVEHGTAVGIVGPNGTGKSTALKLVARILEPSAGRVAVSGRVAALLELGAGFHPDLTGRENIYLNGSLLGLGRREMSRRFDRIVAFSELERFIDVPVKHYSSGMYMRLGFATAIHLDAEILLIDEILAVGDQAFQHKCRERITALRRAGVTILLVSHDTEAVRELCDRAIWLEDGVIRADGPTDRVLQRYYRSMVAREEARLDADEAAAASAATATSAAATSTSTSVSSSGAESTSDGAGGTAGDGAENRNADGAPRTRRTERSDRFGSGEVDITAVDILGPDGQPHPIVLTGQPMSIRLRYTAHAPVDHPVFGIAVHRDDGVHVTGPNTRDADLALERIDGDGELTLHIAHLPLLEGNYEVSAACYDASLSHAYDHHDRRFPLRVRAGDVRERFGLLALGATWTWRGEAAPSNPARPGSDEDAGP